LSRRLPSNFRKWKWIHWCQHFECHKSWADQDFHFYDPATRSFCLLFKDELSSPDSCQRIFNHLATKVNNDQSLSVDASSAFAKVREMASKKLQAKALVVLKKDTIFDMATLLSLNQETINQLAISAMKSYLRRSLDAMVPLCL
jgi:hypothetical protein